MMSPGRSEAIRKVMKGKTPEERLFFLNTIPDAANAFKTLTHEMIHGIGKLKNTFEYGKAAATRLEEAATEFLARAHWKTTVKAVTGIKDANAIRVSWNAHSYQEWVYDLGGLRDFAKIPEKDFLRTVATMHNTFKTTKQKFEFLAKEVSKAYGAPKKWKALAAEFDRQLSSGHAASLTGAARRALL
jgi:hypothetical protein